MKSGAHSTAAPLSVAFVTSLPGWGGGEKWFLETAAVFHERGHRICLLAQPDSVIAERAKERGLPCFGVEMHGIFDPRTLWKIGWILRRERVQLAFASQAREIRLVGLSQLGRRGFRLIARRGSPDPIKNVWHFRWVYNHLVHRLVLNAHALLPKVCDAAPWFDRDKLRVIPNGIDVESYRSTASRERGREAFGSIDGQQIVSMIGEVGWRKDQATFLEAIKRLEGQFPSVLFAIVGEGPERQTLEARALEKGIDSKRLRWLGFRDDVPDLLAASDLVLLPSREEGFPNTILEAMALGCCVVATPVDGIPELVEDRRTGSLVPVADAKALAEAISELLANPSVRERYGEAGAERARLEFDQSIMMDRVEELARESLR